MGGSSRTRSAGAMNRRGPPVSRPSPTPTLLNRTGSVSSVIPPTRSSTVAWPIQQTARSMLFQFERFGLYVARRGGLIASRKRNRPRPRPRKSASRSVAGCFLAALEISLQVNPFSGDERQSYARSTADVQAAGLHDLGAD